MQTQFTISGCHFSLPLSSLREATARNMFGLQANQEEEELGDYLCNYKCLLLEFLQEMFN